MYKQGTKQYISGVNKHKQSGKSKDVITQNVQVTQSVREYRALIGGTLYLVQLLQESSNVPIITSVAGPSKTCRNASFFNYQY